MAIAEISTSTATIEEQDDPMIGDSYDGEHLLNDSRALLQHIVSQLSQIQINRLFNGDQASCRRLKNLLAIKSKLLLLLNSQDGKDAFIEGYNMMINHPQKEVGSIFLQYCSSIAKTCDDLSSWLPPLALDTLEKQVHTPVAFINTLRLLFRTVQTDKAIGDDILLLLRLFGEWDETATRYRSNGWYLYIIGKEAGVCGWYFVMHRVMNDLQSMVESNSCLYWLSTLSLLGLAEWSATQQASTPTPNPLDLHVAALTKLKAFNAITGRSRFQTWFVRLRMEMIHTMQHMLATIETIRNGDLNDYRILKMMNTCASNFRVLASRYDIASQSMVDDQDNALIVVMEDFKVSALILEHASRTCVKSSESDSFFYIDPTLLSLLSKNANSTITGDDNPTFVSTKLSDFRNMCIGFLKVMVKWEEEEQGEGMVEQRYMDVTGTFCHTLLRCPLILPPSFFKLG
ncbi:hypothetical protein BC941DRAFT_421551 [Chlamydoabsidia padenii]|nr:hypothetical protein BC941DRAFT_421551 [Chlamydoabsidia padenii]